MVTRISGMASGMDIDTMVKGLMDAQRVPLDKLNQKKTYTEWQRDDYRDMNTSLLDLDTQIFDGIMKQKTYTQKTVTVSDPNVVSVKNINSVSNFSGTIKVNKLAEAAYMFSNGATTIADSTKKLSDYGVGAQTITIQAINKDGVLDPVPYTLAIDPTTDTLDSVIDKINANSGVSAFYDKNSHQVSIIAKNTGDVAGAEIKLSSTGNFFSGILKLDADSDAAVSASRGKVGVTAEVVYNGMLINRTSNKFTINGAEFTLNKADLTTSVTFSSTPNVDTAVDTIKKFVDKYNELIAKIKVKTDEKKDLNYPPLTDAKKKDMKDTDITKWEAQARKGTLRNDSTLTSLLSTMRNSLYTSVSGASVTQLSDIGITTTSNYMDGGKLQIDEDKLRAALSKDPNGVYELFTKDGTTTGTQGLATRLRSNLSTAMKSISDKAGKATSVSNTFTLGRMLNDYNTQITSFQNRLNSLENRYYKQFTAMEQAVQQANNQSASLSSYFAKN